MSSSKGPTWVVPVMRAGYAARGIVYLIVGILAVQAAWMGGDAEGTQGALQSLRSEPFGQALLWIVGIGLLAYTLWRALAAAMDLEAYGTDGKGIVARLGLTVSAIIHGALAVTAIRLAMGSGSGSGGGSGGGTEHWTAQLMALPWGRWLVIIAGLIVIGTGIYYARKGITEKYKAKMRRTPTTEKLDWFAKAGLLAQGCVVAIIGGFLVYAGWTANPEEAGGLGQAFETVRQAAFGQFLLTLLGLGMICFAILCWLMAAFRIVPRVAGDDVATLAGKAQRGASRARAKMAS